VRRRNLVTLAKGAVEVRNIAEPDVVCDRADAAGSESWVAQHTICLVQTLPKDKLREGHAFALEQLVHVPRRHAVACSDSGDGQRAILQIGGDVALDRLTSKGWKTVQDLVAVAKAKPGSINYGSAGVGTATHIAAEKFRVAAGFEAVHIAYKGGAEALADIVAGRIDFYYCPISTALPFIEDKRVLALAASTPTRAPELPHVPTSLDAGYPNSD